MIGSILKATLRKVAPASALAAVLLFAIPLGTEHLRQLYGSWNLLSDGTIAPSGTVDFYAYWGAFQAQKRGLNPYDPGSLERMRSFAGLSLAGTNYYWNPPWLLVLAAPVLNLPFEKSASLWMLLSILLSILSAVLMWASQNGQPPFLIPCVVAGICFYPMLETLYWGQVGALVTLGVAGFVWATWCRRDLLAGSFLILASLKPHLLYLFFVVVAYWVIVERRYRVLVGTFAAGASLGILVWLWAPDVFQHWLGNSARSWEHISTRKSANLVGFTRGLISDFTGSAPSWLLVAIPIISVLACLAWLLLIRKRIEWSRDLAPVLCCSVFTAPYGWSHDHLVLSLVQVTTIGLVFGGDIEGSKQRMICLHWLAFQLLVLGLSFSFRPAFQFSWFPLGVFFLWLTSSSYLSEQATSGKCRADWMQPQNQAFRQE